MSCLYLARLGLTLLHLASLFCCASLCVLPSTCLQLWPGLASESLTRSRLYCVCVRVCVCLIHSHYRGQSVDECIYQTYITYIHSQPAGQALPPCPFFCCIALLYHPAAQLIALRYTNGLAFPLEAADRRASNQTKRKIIETKPNPI